MILDADSAGSLASFFLQPAPLYLCLEGGNGVSW